MCENDKGDAGASFDMIGVVVHASCAILSPQRNKCEICEV